MRHPNTSQSCDRTVPLGTRRYWLSAVGAVLCLLLPIGSGALLSTASRAQSVPLQIGYWHTSGTRILDDFGQQVRIAGVTWYGMDTSTWVPAGLKYQRYSTIMDLIKLLGYNTIRLPISNELVERDPVVGGNVAANPELQGETALQVLDAIVQYAGQIGLKIILDDHRSRAAPPLEVNSLYEPFWYTPQYPESSWIRDWQTLALRYRDNDAVIGVDLRNEPHPEGPGPWDLATYLKRSPTWGPYGGVDNPVTDWRLAAERAGNAILAINPRLLIVVQGLQVFPDSSVSNGVRSSWWAGLLTPVKLYPVNLHVANQLVYSIHEWGPRKHVMPWFTHMTYASLQAAWRRNWAYLLDHPSAPYAAPVLLGEFGTCNENAACVEGHKAGTQGYWFQMMVRFVREHPEIGWSFFALNGTNANDCATDNGLLNHQWNNISNLALQRTLRTIQPSPGILPPSTAGTLLPGTSTSRQPRSATSRLCQLP